MPISVTRLSSVRLASSLFESSFASRPAVAATAPGRVNLIGEHTDYHDGFVMPSAVPQHTTALLTPRNDRTIRLSSDLMRDPVEYQLGHEQRRNDWSDYV